MYLSNFDIFILFLFLFCAIIGLLRGFIKETFSILNWILSFYFLSLFKPIIKTHFSKLIKIPFLSDVIINTLSFIIILIVLSILSKYISNLIKKIMPCSLDITLGFVFGLVKAYIILFLITSTIEIVCNDKEPEILNKSVFNGIFFSNDIVNDKIKILLGDFLNKKNNNKNENDIDNDSTINNDNTVNNDNIINNNIDIIEDKIENLNMDDVIELDIPNELSNKIEGILESL